MIVSKNLGLTHNEVWETLNKIIKDDLQQILVMITQHQEENHNDLLNLIKIQGYQQATQPYPSDSTISSTSPPLSPPPPYNSNLKPISQYQTLIIYPFK